MGTLRRLGTWAMREWLTIAIIAIGIGVQIFLVTRPFDVILQTLIPDDAFFIFKVAANVVAGLGSTFDGINPSNGYHPLWVGVLVVIYKFFGIGLVGDVGPIKIALYVQVALNAMTALIVARILTRFSRSAWIRAFGMIVWLLNPFLLYETLNGIETALALFFFSIFP